MTPAQRKRWIGFAAGCFLPMAALAASSQTCVLSSTTGVFSLDVPIDLQEKEIVFRKEPDFGGRSVIRGAITTGAGSTNFVGFALDLAKRTLYLDRNRNLDLTDDPSRVLTSEEIPGYVNFEKMDLELPVGAATVPYVFDLVCYGSGANAHCELKCRSGWQGEVVLAGEKWSLGVVDNLDGVIDGADVFILRKPSGKVDDRAVSEADRLPAAASLCVNGEAVSLAFAFRGEGAAPGLEVTAAPLETAMGSLQIEGASIRRILMAGPCSVVLDRPSGTVRVPAGQYTKVTIYVSHEDSPDGIFTAQLWPLSVSAGGTTALKAGGPLRNCLSASRSGSMLKMDYEQKGIDGVSYRALNCGTEHGPQFVIRRGGAEVASGSFEYG